MSLLAIIWVSPRFSKTTTSPLCEAVNTILDFTRNIGMFTPHDMGLFGIPDVKTNFVGTVLSYSVEFLKFFNFVC